MSGAVQPTFRIDVAINDLLLHSALYPPIPPEPKGLTLPEPVFPQYPELLSVPGSKPELVSPEVPAASRISRVTAQRSLIKTIGGAAVRSAWFLRLLESRRRAP